MIAKIQSKANECESKEAFDNVLKKQSVLFFMAYMLPVMGIYLFIAVFAGQIENKIVSMFVIIPIAFVALILGIKIISASNKIKDTAVYVPTKISEEGGDND